MATTAVRNVEIAEQMYTDFNTGDVEAVLSRMDENVKWVESEGDPLRPGTVTGPEAVLEHVFAPFGEAYSEDSQVTPERFIDAGDTVVVEGRFTGTVRETGKPIDAAFCHVFDLKDGVLTEFHGHWDTAIVADAMDK